MNTAHALTQAGSRRPRRRGRPPNNLNSHNETRRRLLLSGVEVLTEKGYSATGIDEILRKVNVPKGSFYHYFKSKDEFGLMLIDEYAQFFIKKLDTHLLNDELAPLDRIKAFITDAEQGMARYGFNRGCLIGNLGQEMGRLPEKFRQRLTEVFKDWQSQFEQCLLLAQKNDQLSSHLNCSELAQVFWIGWEGAVLRAKLEQSPEPLQIFSKYFLQHISK